MGGEGNGDEKLSSLDDLIFELWDNTINNE